MVGDLFFRAFFSALWVAFLAIFSWVAHSTKWSAGRRTTRHANRLRAVALVFACLYFAGALFYALVPSWVVIFSIPLPDSFRIVMVAVAVLGMCFIMWALRSLGKNWAPSLSGVRKDTFLVTTGPYGVVRHPIYLGAFIFLAAQAFLAANLLTLLPTLILVVLLYVQLPDEENMLIDRFGEEYREYMKRTPRFIPSLKHKR